MFKVNDIVVYRRIVCRIVGKHRSDFTKEMCYILVPYHADEGSTRMQVPIANKAGHLRALITKEEIEELKAAREMGDLSENADYDAARTKQSEVETSIIKKQAQLRELNKL